MTLVIVLGEIDISVGAVFAVCSIICGTFAKVGVPAILWPLVALAAGSVLGATNGTLVSFVKAPSIVVTLATMVAWREALRWITNGAWIEGLPNTFQWFGLGQRTGEAVIGIGLTAVWRPLVDFQKSGRGSRRLCDRLGY